MDEKKQLNPPEPPHRSRASWKVVLGSVLALQLVVSWCAIHISALGLKSHAAAVAQASPARDVVTRAYLSTLETSNLAGKWSRKYGSQPQLAGTNMEMVNWTRDMFAGFGIDASIDEYLSYVSYPEEAAVTLLGANDSTVYEASLKEDPVDEWSRNFSVPAFLGYGADGNVSAEYVYCNYGSKEDFDTLEGKVAVIRYMGLFRGLKVKFAQEHGLIGAILYSDPYEDGNVTVQNGYKAYPDGPARQPSAIQRGSAQFLSQLPGDPTTPGFAIKPGENKTRADPHDSTGTIPVLPLSARDVAPILQKLSGHGLSLKETGWKMGLIPGFDYSVGPNPAFKLNVYSKQNFTIAPMHNIMGEIKGKNEDDVIIIGNHHDSWTYDSGDPHSGSAVMLEIARGFGELLKMGWQPERTILLASWDGEEYGLLGSTEYGEYWADKLQKNVVAYLNLDVSVSGPNLNLQGSPLLFELLLDTLKGLNYTPDQSLYDHFRSVSPHGVGNLGSGSDYTVFLEYLGIPSVDMGFSATANSAVYHYHSIFDNYHWMSTFADPGFKKHNIIAKYLGLLALKLSETKVIPLSVSPYSLKLQEFFDKVVAQIPDEWYGQPAFSMCGAHKNVTVGALVGHVKHKLGKLSHKSFKFDAEAADLQHSYDNWNELSYWSKLKLVIRIRAANSELKYYERQFLNKDGLKNRPWFKHIVFASGRYTGYAGQQLPALTEALEDAEFDDFVKNLKFFDKVVGHLL